MIVAKLIECAFCEGEGIDPFAIPSPLSSCQVCWGKGVVKVKVPMVACPDCRGTGQAPESKLPCLPCDGKGVIGVMI